MGAAVDPVADIPDAVDPRLQRQAAEILAAAHDRETTMGQKVRRTA